MVCLNDSTQSVANHFFSSFLFHFLFHLLLFASLCFLFFALLPLLFSYLLFCFSSFHFSLLLFLIQLLSGFLLKTCAMCSWDHKQYWVVQQGSVTCKKSFISHAVYLWPFDNLTYKIKKQVFELVLSQQNLSSVAILLEQEQGGDGRGSNQYFIIISPTISKGMDMGEGKLLRRKIVHINGSVK